MTADKSLVGVTDIAVVVVGGKPSAAVVGDCS